MDKSVPIKYVDPNMAQPISPEYRPLQSQCQTANISRIGDLMKQGIDK